MNEVIKSDLVAGLRNLYQKDGSARRLFDKLASFQKDTSITLASRAAVLADASHGETVALLRKLDRLGAGEFKVGRRGSKTRIEWRFSVRSLGAAAQGAAGQPDEIDPAQIEDAGTGIPESDAPEFDFTAGDSEWIAHSFQLRPNLRLTLKLPVDLNAKEAERIAGFIRQVPFDD